MKDLTVSNIERQNVLNNRFAINKIQKQLDIPGMLFEGEYWLTKKMVAEIYGVDVSTIDRYLASNGDELKHNGYVLCKGKSLKEFKLQFAHLINEASKTTQLGLFNFRAFLNMGMLLTESERAKKLRSMILDLVIATIHEKTGGGTKYINRRDIIYKAVFKENAKEYREILRLDSKDNVRHTLYAEVLLVISSFENGVGAAIQEQCKQNGKVKLTIEEVERIVGELAEHPMQKPYLNDARTKMASRDFSFRDAYHGNIGEYLRAVTPEEFERFIGDQSVDFDRILENNKDVLKRLKQAEDE